ncbi:MAG TPA: TetR/AcrR family transcriptional regulator [Gemmatirosa sp.]
MPPSSSRATPTLRAGRPPATDGLPSADPRAAADRAPDAGAAEVAPPRSSLLRRVPQQDRGQRRIERILDAAADVIAEVGVDGASTNAIAARAATSVGSLYQFFPNKDAIVQALAARYAAEFEALKEQVMAPEVADRPLPAMMRGIVEPIMAYCAANPAYRHVFAATTTPGAPCSPEEAAVHEAIVRRVEGLIARRTPWVPEAQRHVTAVVQVETVHEVLFFAQGQPPAAAMAIVDELVRMLVCALAPFDAMRPADWPGDAPVA